MERQGKHFEFGYPHIFGGIDYSYPNSKINYKKRIEEKKEELENLCMNNLKKYMVDFKIDRDFPHYPYLQDGQEGFALHIGDGGRWIEVWDEMGIHFINGHNLDSYIERAVAFNIGSDILEHVDKNILAPRILFEKEKFTIKYYLPNGLKLIPEQKFLNEELINRIFKVAELKNDAKIITEKDYQEIKNSDGGIIIKDGICEGKNFEGWKFHRATWVAAKVMGPCGN